jgi:hypothetical protein
MTEPKTRYPLNTYELIALSKWLPRCTFGVGSPEKRFVRQNQNATALTEKQREWLRKITYRYRRQIGLSDDKAEVLCKQMEAPVEALAEQDKLL